MNTEKQTKKYKKQYRIVFEKNISVLIHFNEGVYC